MPKMSKDAPVHWCQYPDCYKAPKSKVNGLWYCKMHARAERKKRR